MLSARVHAQLEPKFCMFISNCTAIQLMFEQSLDANCIYIYICLLVCSQRIKLCVVAHTQ